MKPQNWTFRKGSEPHNQALVYNEDTGEDIAVTYNDEDGGHARLIAAAPELLAECMRAQDEIASALRDGVTHFNEDMLRRWYKGVSEAITKAKNP